MKRMKPLQDVGLGYVKLVNHLHFIGGESQRVKLAFFLEKKTESTCLFSMSQLRTSLP